MSKVTLGLHVVVSLSARKKGVGLFPYLAASYPFKTIRGAAGSEADVQHAGLRYDDVLAQLGHCAEEPLLDVAVSGNLRDGFDDGTQLRLLNDSPVVEIRDGSGPGGRAVRNMCQMTSC